MLSYSFKILEQDQYQEIGEEYFDFIGDMFAEILSQGVSSLLKRGLSKEYILKEEALHGIKSKLNVSESVKTLSMIKKKMVCEFDEFSENILLNQIIKTTSMLLIKSKEVSRKSKVKLRNSMLFFDNVDIIDVQEINFKNLHFHKNNKTYELLMNLCYLILEGLLIKENGEGLNLRKHINDSQMYSLYENFVLNYYKRHFPELKPRGRELKWNASSDLETSLSLLPNMYTDITLHGKNKTLIIDTKYYTNSMTDRNTLISNNIYQIYAYVSTLQQQSNKKVSGMLLYAKTDTDTPLDDHLTMNTLDISFKTLDLNMNFKDIKKQLNSIPKLVS